MTLDVVSDTIFRDQAARTLEEFRKSHRLVVRSQIKGLRLMAVNEPSKVREFAGHQRQAQKHRTAEEIGAGRRNRVLAAGRGAMRGRGQCGRSLVAQEVRPGSSPSRLPGPNQTPWLGPCR